LKPLPLKKGSLISIAAPAGPFDRSRFRRGIALLKKAGFRVAFDRGIFSEKAYLAGDDNRRARELDRALSDSQSCAVLMARGGYGCQRVIPLLAKKPSPKIVVGSSDLTAVLIHLWKKYRLPSYYGPMVAPHFINQKNVSRLRRALTDPDFHRKQRLIARKILKPGRASGRLVGGCLSLLTATIGTPLELDTDNAILFLEDTNEEAYAVDRMLTQMEQAGKLKKVRGLVLGTFRQKKTLFPRAIEAVFSERFKNRSIPILWGVRFGHCLEPLFLPFGGEGHIRGNELVITKGIF